MAHIKNEKLLVFRKKSVELVTYKSKNIITYEMTYVYLDYLIPVKAGAKYIFTNISRLFFFLTFPFPAYLLSSNQELYSESQEIFLNS